jgi:hypothetical protein
VIFFDDFINTECVGYTRISLNVNESQMNSSINMINLNPVLTPRLLVKT